MQPHALFHCYLVEIEQSASSYSTITGISVKDEEFGVNRVGENWCGT